MVTNAIANAGMRVRWNIWNLYIHLCWQTVEQQFIPALAIASAVGSKFRNRGKLQNINLLRLFRSLNLFFRQKISFDKTEFQLDNFYFSPRQFWLDSFGLNCSARILHANSLHDKSGSKNSVQLFDWNAFPKTCRIWKVNPLKTFNDCFSCQLRIYNKFDSTEEKPAANKY